MGKSIADLVPPSTEVVKTAQFWFRVEPLSVERAWRERLALGYALSGVKQAEADGEQAGAAMPLSPAQMEELGKSTVKAMCVGVIEMAGAPDGDEEPAWEPVRLVPDRKQENRDATPPRIYVGAIQRALSQDEMTAVAAVALEPIARAIAEVRPLSETPGGS